MTQKYPRDLAGYGASLPDPQWPGGARIAVQLALNYEEGGENCVLHGDSASEAFLSEIIGADARQSVRHLSMESIYEYGSRVGVWRLKHLFETYQVPVTVFAVGMAVERNPQPILALHAAGHEICSHGYRWIDYQYVDESTERAHIQFYQYLKDSFDVLYAEGRRTPRMMSVGLHCRLAGRPGRFAALERFLRYARSFDDVWWCRRIDIARHWHEKHSREVW